MPVAVPGSGWETLNGYVEALREAAEGERDLRENPVACPNDGEPLRETPDGGLFCPWDGWRP